MPLGPHLEHFASLLIWSQELSSTLFREEKMQIKTKMKQKHPGSATANLARNLVIFFQGMVNVLVVVNFFTSPKSGRVQIPEVNL